MPGEGDIHLVLLVLVSRKKNEKTPSLNKRPTSIADDLDGLLEQLDFLDLEFTYKDIPQFSGG